MNRKLSKRLLIAEAVVLALPVTALLALGITTISISADSDAWRMAENLITVLATLAALGGWWLILKAVCGGAEALRATHLGWWLTASIGVVLLLLAVVSMLLPASPDSTSPAFLRQHLERCAMGAPLVVILGHLLAEAMFRKTANQPLNAIAPKNGAPH